MGRYYSGDIEGKFASGLQDSNCATRFGGQTLEPRVIKYFFDADDLESVEAEIKIIEEKLGDKKEKCAALNGYSEKILEDIDVTLEELNDYYDLNIGYQIRDSIKEKGSCSFTAEI